MDETNSATKRRRALAAIARRQDQLFTIAQARSRGFAHSTVRRWVETGRCRRWSPSVLSDAAVGDTWQRRVRAAFLHAGEGTVVTGLTAARLHGLRAPQAGVVELAVPRSRHHRWDEVVVHRPLTMPTSCTMDRMVVATVPATLLAIAGRLDGDELEDAVADAVRRRGTTLALVAKELRAAPVNLAGRGRLRDVLQHLGAGARAKATGRRSPLETRFASLLRSAGLPEPMWGRRHDVDGRRFELDACWPDHGIAVEVDGHRFHGTPGELQADGNRQNLLVVDGLRPLRFTHDDIVHNADATVDIVRRALDGCSQT